MLSSTEEEEEEEEELEEDDKKVLQFNCLPDTFISSLSPSPNLLQQMRKLFLTTQFSYFLGRS